MNVCPGSLFYMREVIRGTIVANDEGRERSRETRDCNFLSLNEVHVLYRKTWAPFARYYILITNMSLKSNTQKTLKSCSNKGQKRLTSELYLNRKSPMLRKWWSFLKERKWGERKKGEYREECIARGNSVTLDCKYQNNVSAQSRS